LGQSADGLVRVGSHKMDPWTTLEGRNIGLYDTNAARVKITKICDFCVYKKRHWFQFRFPVEIATSKQQVQLTEASDNISGLSQMQKKLASMFRNSGDIIYY